MANTLNGNTFYVDATSSAAGSYLESKDLIVEAFIVSAAAAGSGSIAIHDLSKSNGAFAAGDLKLNISVLASTTSVLSLDKVPITFPNGIWVVPAANTTATLILRFKG